MVNNLDIERLQRDNMALELVLHGWSQRDNEFRAWYFWDRNDGVYYALQVYDYGMVSFGQRIDGRMIWFPVGGEVEKQILETVEAWHK